ncbi:hypothetical protein E6H16_10640 [Candidatus Bathyarchaeota archaeon]|nr:MAG: hypothetical protein E6H16_10640 [Candidatus Bathyarchaeota archaeon]
MVAQVQVDLTKANAIEFTTKDEPWIKYKLDDGTLLFGRLVIAKIFRGDQNIFATIVPKPLRGTPTNPPPTSLDPNITNTTQVDFERVGPERWNVYEISDGSVLRAKLEITGILRTDKYGPDGDPLYIINNQPIQRMKVAANLIKKHMIPQKDTSRKDIYG